MKYASQSSLTCSTRDAARLLGVSIRTAQLWVEDGRLRAWKTPGGHRRILVESVDRLLDEQRRAGLPVGRASYGVLLLRDDDRERAALLALLDTLLPECVVSAAASGFEGLIQVGENAPDVLITDLRVTGLDSFRMVQSLIGHVQRRPMRVVVLLPTGADRAAVAARMPPEVVLVDAPVDGPELAALVWGLLSAQDSAPAAKTPARARISTAS